MESNGWVMWKMGTFNDPCKSWPYWAIHGHTVLFWMFAWGGSWLVLGHCSYGPTVHGIGANHWYDICSCRPGNSSMTPKPIHIDAFLFPCRRLGSVSALEWTWAQSGQTLERSWQKKDLAIENHGFKDERHIFLLYCGAQQIYIYIYIYIHIYICMHAYMYVCVYVYIYRRVFLYFLRRRYCDLVRRQRLNPILLLRSSFSFTQRKTCFCWWNPPCPKPQARVPNFLHRGKAPRGFRPTGIAMETLQTRSFCMAHCHVAGPFRGDVTDKKNLSEFLLPSGKP